MKFHHPTFALIHFRPQSRMSLRVNNVILIRMEQVLKISLKVTVHFSSINFNRNKITHLPFEQRVLSHRLTFFMIELVLTLFELRPEYLIRSNGIFYSIMKRIVFHGHRRTLATLRLSISVPMFIMNYGLSKSIETNIKRAICHI